jgi:hypothetical protein
MTGTTLYAFRELAEAMRDARDPGPTTWEWVGEHMSQRMFNLTKARATWFATFYGGEARPMKAEKLPDKYAKK